MAQSLLKYGYDGNINDPEVFSVLQRVKNAQSLAPEHIQSVEGFKMVYPEVDWMSPHFVEDLFRDMLKKALPKGCKNLPIYADLKKFHKLVDQAAEEMMRVANHLIAIRHSSPRSTSKKLYLGVLAELMEKKITPGGKPSAFVKRCLLMFEKIIEGKQFQDSIDRHIHRIQEADWDQLIQDLQEVANELRTVDPIDDIKTIDTYNCSLAVIDVKTKSDVHRIFGALRKNLRHKSQMNKNDLSRFCNKAVRHLNRHFKKIKRITNNDHPSTRDDVGLTNASNEAAQAPVSPPIAVSVPLEVPVGVQRKEMIADLADGILAGDKIKKEGSNDIHTSGSGTAAATLNEKLSIQKPQAPCAAELNKKLQSSKTEDDFLIIPVSVVDCELTEGDVLYSPHYKHISETSSRGTGPLSNSGYVVYHDYSSAACVTSQPSAVNVEVPVSVSVAVTTEYQHRSYLAVEHYTQDKTHQEAVNDQGITVGTDKTVDDAEYYSDDDFEDDFDDDPDDDTTNDEAIARLLAEEFEAENKMEQLKAKLAAGAGTDAVIADVAGLRLTESC